MKKIVSILVILSMLIAFVPAALADDTATAPADVVYDFTAWTSTGTGYNFAINGSYGQAASSWKEVEAANGDGMRVNVGNVWEGANAGKYCRAAIDITVTEPGYYSPSFTGGLTANGYKASIYLGDKYLGDYDFTYSGTEATSNTKCVVGTEKRFNSVYLEEGTHTLVFCFRAGEATAYAFFQNFKLYGLAGEPTIAGVNSAVPTDVMSVGNTRELTAQVVDSNGNTVSFGDYAAYNATTENTTNYLKVTSDNEDIVKVTSYAKGGLCNSENTNYSIEARGGGVANLKFTPYIDGVAQTSYTKSVSVAGPIVVDFSKTTKTDGVLTTPGYTIDDTNGTVVGNWASGYGDYSLVRATTVKTSDALWATNANNNRYRKAAWKVNVPQSGFYSVKLQGGLTVVGGIASVYANSSYAGDYDFHTTDSVNTSETSAVLGAEKTLNTVYLAKGQNVIFVAPRVSFSGELQTRTFMRKLTLTPVSSLAGKTEIAVSSVSSTDIPTTMTVGASAAASATVTMEDASVRSFAAYASNATADTNDSVTVTSSAPEIISVESCEDDELGASDKTTFTLRANKAGSADITVTATVGSSTETATYTVKANENNPNSVTTNPTVSVYIGAENADESLITVLKGGIVAGDVDGTVARGTTVSVTAESSENYEFLYWMDNAKRYIQDGKTYTFTAGTNTAIFAVYADKTDELKLYDYFTDSGTRIYSKEAESEAEITSPTLEMTGYTGGVWKKSIDSDEYVTFTPDWGNATKAAASATLNGEAHTSGSYGDEVTVSKTSASFVCWKKNGSIVSYNDTYTFYMWNALEAVVESTVGEKSTFPAVALFANGSKYMLELVNCEGVEIVEKGILFGGTIDSCEKKFVSRTALSQFTITEDTYTDAKAYLIYRDGTDLRVAYSD